MMTPALLLLAAALAYLTTVGRYRRRRRRVAMIAARLNYRPTTCRLIVMPARKREAGSVVA